MPQGFQYGKPIFKSPLASSEVRVNFQALSTYHRGVTAPASPQLGYAWIDDSVASNWKLKWYVKEGATYKWVVVLSHLESDTPVLGEAVEDGQITFFEGDTPPPMINIDTFNFEDAAGFDTGVNQDIIFRLQPERGFTHGIQLYFRYFLNGTVSGAVKLQLSYKVVTIGGDPEGGTLYTSTYKITPLPAEDIVTFVEFNIPKSRIPTDTAWIHCRLMRLGTDTDDTYTGQFCLMSISRKST